MIDATDIKTTESSNSVLHDMLKVMSVKIINSCKMQIFDQLTGRQIVDNFAKDTFEYCTIFDREHTLNITYEFNVTRTIWLKSTSYQKLKYVYQESEYYCIFFDETSYVLNNVEMKKFDSENHTDLLFWTTPMKKNIPFAISHGISILSNVIVTDKLYYLNNNIMDRLLCKISFPYDIYKTIDSLTDDDFQTMTYGDSGTRIFNDDMRKSKICKKSIICDMNCDINMHMNDAFELIKYDIGGHFSKHRDRQRHPNHKFTIILYPPQTIDGGDLKMYPFDDDTFTVTIKMDPLYWVGVIFPIDTRHESVAVSSGNKIL